MRVEDNLRLYILDRYPSLREFAIIADISNSTLDSMLKRGIANSSINNVIKMCKTLGISADELAENRITPIANYNHTLTDSVEINDILSEAKKQLATTYNLTLDGIPVDRKIVVDIINAITIGVELAKKKK